MAYFKDAQEVYETIGKLFQDLVADDELAPKFRQADTIVRYRYSEPVADIAPVNDPDLAMIGTPVASTPDVAS